MKYKKKGNNIKYFIYDSETEKSCLVSRVEYDNLRINQSSKLLKRLYDLQTITDNIYVYCYEYSKHKSVRTVVLTDLCLSTENLMQFEKTMREQYKYFRIYTIKGTLL